MRFLILCVLLTACTTTRYVPVAPQNAAPKPVATASSRAPEKAKPAAPRNFVCERFAYVNEKAVCTPEFTDVGEHHTHSARVAIDQQMISCAIDDRTPQVMCGDFIVIAPPQHLAPVEDKKPAPKKGKSK